MYLLNQSNHGLNVIIFCLFISGIEYLVLNNLLKMNAKDIALFLYKGEGLNKTAIGKVS